VSSEFPVSVSRLPSVSVSNECSIYELVVHVQDQVQGGEDIGARHFKTHYESRQHVKSLISKSCLNERHPAQHDVLLFACFALVMIM